MKIYKVNILICFLVFFTFWPPYFDFRISENIGVLPVRLIYLIFFVFLIFHFLKIYELSNFSFVRNNKLLAIIIFLYVLIRFISASLSDFYSISLVIFEYLSNINILLISYFFISNVKEIKKIVELLIKFSVILSIIAILEHVLKFNFFTFLASSSTEVGFVALSDKIRNGFYRAQAVFEHPLSLSQYLSVTFPFVLIYYKTNQKFKFYTYSLLMILGQYSTGSRTGFIAIIFGVLCYAFMSLKLPVLRSDRMKVKILIWGVCLLILPLIYTVLLTVSSVDSNNAEGSSSRTRIYQIENGIMAANEKPIFGYGAGHSDEVIFKISQYNFSAKLYIATIDNLFLSELVSSGYIALFFYISILLIPLIYLFKFERSEISTVLACSIICSIITMMTLSIFSILPLIFMILGMSLAYTRKIGNCNFNVIINDGVNGG